MKFDYYRLIADLIEYLNRLSLSNTKKEKEGARELMLKGQISIRQNVFRVVLRQRCR
jgi:hypothetical protein